jgi:hypothetical protein
MMTRMMMTTTVKSIPPVLPFHLSIISDVGHSAGHPSIPAGFDWKEAIWHEVPILPHTHIHMEQNFALDLALDFDQSFVHDFEVTMISHPFPFQLLGVTKGILMFITISRHHKTPMHQIHFQRHLKFDSTSDPFLHPRNVFF